MEDLDFSFDATTVEPSQTIEILPPGTYNVQIVQAEKRPTKDGQGAYLWIEMDIIDGPHVGRKLWDRLNIWNRNETAAKIANQSLSSICHAVGVPVFKSFSEVMHKPLAAVVKVRPSGPDKNGIERDASNEVKGYKSAEGAARPTAAAPARPAPTPAASVAPKPAGTVPAWARRSA